MENPPTSQPEGAKCGSIESKIDLLMKSISEPLVNEFKRRESELVKQVEFFRHENDKNAKARLANYEASLQAHEELKRARDVEARLRARITQLFDLAYPPNDNLAARDSTSYRDLYEKCQQEKNQLQCEYDVMKQVIVNPVQQLFEKPKTLLQQLTEAEKKIDRLEIENNAQRVRIGELFELAYPANPNIGARVHGRTNQELLAECQKKVNELQQELDTLKANYPTGQVEQRDQALTNLKNVQAELTSLRDQINTPEVHDFIKGVKFEAVHQANRWGEQHDASKTGEDWLFLFGHLTGKAVQAARLNQPTKAKHHAISAAAALYNWHARHTSASE